MIINQTNVPYITDSDLIWLKDCNLNDIYDFSNHDYYLIQFLDTKSIDIEKLSLAIPNNILQKVKNKELVLALGNQFESFHSTVSFVYKKLIIDLNIPEEQILLLTSNPTVLDVVNENCKVFDKKPIKCAWCRVFEYNTAVQEYHVVKSKYTDKSNKKFTKKYICLNRRWRPHRAAIVALLACNNLLDQGYISLGECEGGSWDKIYSELLELNNSDEFKAILLNNKDTILNLPYLYVDTPALENNIPEFRISLKQFYDDSFFSIITETPYYSNEIYNEGIMLSEKVFKAISQRHPFLMLNRPYALKALQSIGYKTFSPYIDESYDDEVNDSIRLLKIIKEVKKLCSLNDEQISEFIMATKGICDYNYHHMVDQVELNFIHPDLYKLSSKYSTNLN